MIPTPDFLEFSPRARDLVRPAWEAAYTVHLKRAPGEDGRGEEYASRLANRFWPLYMSDFKTPRQLTETEVESLKKDARDTSRAMKKLIAEKSPNAPTPEGGKPAAKFCDHPGCRVWFPDDGPACPNHKDPGCALHGPTDTGASPSDSVQSEEG